MTAVHDMLRDFGKAARKASHRSPRAATFPLPSCASRAAPCANSLHLWPPGGRRHVLAALDHAALTRYSLYREVSRRTRWASHCARRDAAGGAPGAPPIAAAAAAAGAEEA
jgi:hypothetical protein